MSDAIVVALIGMLRGIEATTYSPISAKRGLGEIEIAADFVNDHNLAGIGLLHRK